MKEAIKQLLNASDVKIKKDYIEIKLNPNPQAPSATHIFDNIAQDRSILAKRAYRTKWRPKVGERVLCTYSYYGVVTVTSIEDDGIGCQEIKHGIARQWLLPINKKNLLDMIRKYLQSYNAVVTGSGLMAGDYWEWRHKNLPEIKNSIKQLIAEYRKCK